MRTALPSRPTSPRFACICQPNFPRAFTGEGSPSIHGRSTACQPPRQAIRSSRILDAEGIGHRSVKYKLRDWLFQPAALLGRAVSDRARMPAARPMAIPEAELPLTLPDLADFKPTGTPEPR